MMSKKTRKKIEKVWQEYSYWIISSANKRRMTEIGFLQAIQKLGVEITDD